MTFNQEYALLINNAQHGGLIFNYILEHLISITPLGCLVPEPLKPTQLMQGRSNINNNLGHNISLIISYKACLLACDHFIY